MSASCGVCERDLEFGYLCPGDILALAERLEQLPGLADALSGALAPAARPVTERVTTSGYGPSTPVNDSALELWYGGMATVLERWRSDIQSWKGWGEPVVEGSVEHRVRAACRWIGMNLEWIAAEYPSAGDLGKEVRELKSAALSILGDGRGGEGRGKLLGRCVNADASGAACGAPIRHREGEATLVCEWCHCVYRDEQDWLLLLHYQPKEPSDV
ncbi:hypothetical protein GFH48_19000 [Streptomyces fagopyri]|uniref:Uncharacterized protein n=1 Tax=Streptomyces fagopyri TaxID=2662397 RepID=A0A5Q0LEU1_9ACTN|nr:hypothetical protein [Streptomyces fagopyri]QFZ75077.1 hypothetical protein GFH48_19000 [Streptomyces fagopyri]